MFATAVIVFREVLEAALLIGIIAAATRSVPSRNRWLFAGLLAGLAGSALVAASMGAIANLADGVGQELFNAIILGIAILMLGWHNIWMATHGKAMAEAASKVGQAIRNGQQERSILLVVVGLAVLREGSETVLFLYSISAAEGSAPSSIALGGLIGLLCGVIVGYTVYMGLLRIPLRWFFATTEMLVLLLAAGMASQAARLLVQADILTKLTTPLWDTSAMLPVNSIPGMLLHSLVGYDPKPAGIQLIFYVFTLAAIAMGMKLANRSLSSITNKGNLS